MFRAEEVPWVGNCMYESVCRNRSGAFPHEIHHGELRRQVMEFARDNEVGRDIARRCLATLGDQVANAVNEEGFSIYVLKQSNVKGTFDEVILP